ncbi:zinc ribbon domain-containing protein [Winogradskyella sp.]|uniref:zinc-ribbon domain-containing protein n=1 Tax=Winogradskyella sp. TaxID=1883156 RepID=UPI0025F7BCB6|nr:zinc ribbon domain-containing protein [Winogradskyella sp.]
MTHCSNCNAILKEGVKFCTNCGAPIKKVEQTKKVNPGLTVLGENTPKSRSKGTKILVGLIAVIALFFIVRALVTNIDISRNSMSISKALNKIEGEWYDPTGELLEDTETVITFRKRGDVVIGEDKNKTLYIQLLAIGTDEYSGLVVLNGNDDNVIVQYYHDDNQLIFLSKISENSWSLKKIN